MLFFFYLQMESYSVSSRVYEEPHVCWFKENKGVWLDLRASWQLVLLVFDVLSKYCIQKVPLCWGCSLGSSLYLMLNLFSLWNVLFLKFDLIHPEFWSQGKLDVNDDECTAANTCKNSKCEPHVKKPMMLLFFVCFSYNYKSLAKWICCKTTAT